MNIRKELENMTAEDFAALGLESVVYIKPVVEDGVTRFAVHNAAGATVGVLPSDMEAPAALIEHDLHQATIH